MSGLSESRSAHQSTREDAQAGLRRPGLQAPSGLHGRREGQEGDAPLSTLSSTTL